jgi:hypothetical protein
MNIKQEILDAVDPVEFWQQEFEEWDGKDGSLVHCPMTARHEGGDDSTASLGLRHDGRFKCLACNWHGTSIVGYYADRYFPNSFKFALKKLYNRYVHPIINKQRILQYQEKLTDRIIQRAEAVRGWNEKTIRRLKLGWNPREKRITIPVFNYQGYCLDIRHHDTFRKQRGSGRNPVLGEKGVASMQWFPLNPRYNPFANGKPIYCVEGEADAILAYQEGLNVVTLTGGAGAWASLPYGRLQSFRGRDVIICFDNDRAGKDASRAFARRLAEVDVNSVKIVRLPGAGWDLGDYLQDHGHTVEDFRLLVSQTEFHYQNKKRRAVEIPLALTSEAQYAHKPVRTKVLVSGKSQAPYVVPHRFELTCSPGEEGYCSNCPCSENEGRGVFVLHPDDRNLLEWVYAKPQQYDKLLRATFKTPNKCALTGEVISYQNLEQCILIPGLTNSASKDHGAYVERQGFYLGHNLESNQQYSVNATPLPHPKTNESVLLVTEAEKASDSITTYHMADEEVARIQGLFDRPAKSTLRSIARQHSHNVTKIIGREDLHLAVDLCFHSPLELSFNNTDLPKGSLELLLFGDTRCGKGQVAEGLVNYYDLGATVSGENASLMGLIGGAAKLSDGRFTISWGALPLNHGRLVVIDEFSGLGAEILGKTSRVRSEGFAEIDKAGHHAKTPANTRTIWIANPKKGREVSYFSTGVAGILDLVSAQEDIARFDLAVVVTKDEVDNDAINRTVLEEIETPFTQQVLRQVLLWVWSRKREQIIFTPEATQAVLDAAVRLSHRYSDTIPLIQGENVRFKLAKLAAAVAGRCFSTTDGVHLVITEEHVKVAVAFIKLIYDKEACGYLAYSETQGKKQHLSNQDLLRDLFDQHDKETRQLLVDSLLEATVFNADDLSYWLEADVKVAKSFIGSLMRANAVKSASSGYVKRSAFTRWLRNYRG